MVNADSKHRCAALVPLDRHDCERLLSEHHLGRVALVIDGAPSVYPVNYAWTNDQVVFATESTWGKIALDADQVGFQIDRADNLSHNGWSVLVVGRVQEFTGPESATPKVAPWCGITPATRWLMLSPERITGRRIELVDGR